jgi:hypothetical protein
MLMTAKRKKIQLRLNAGSRYNRKKMKSNNEEPSKA